VEVTASKTEPFVGESVDLRLRFGFDADLLANHLVPLFARELDLPVQVEWSGESGIEGLSFREEPIATPGRARARSVDVDDTKEVSRTFALGDRVEAATQVAESVREGRSFKTFEFRRLATTTRAGALEIPAARLRFACASKIEDDLIRGRVAID